jgi:hypothetical protein
MNTIKSHWEVIEKNARARNMPHEVIEQMQSAFYAGATASMKISMDLSHRVIQNEISADAAMAVARSLKDEIKSYFIDGGHKSPE